MKKFNAKFLLTQAAIILAISVVAGLVISICMGAANVLNATMTFAILLFLVIGFIYVSLCNVITGPMAQKTMEKYSQENGFENYSTFVTDASFTAGSIIRIDEKSGRVAYVSYQNPHEFQMAFAKDITKIKSSYLKGPLGGTNYVYFEFYFNNKRVRIPTFTANNVYSLKSAEVLEGISKADLYCDILKNAQNQTV